MDAISSFQVLLLITLVSICACTIDDNRIDAETQSFRQELGTLSTEINFVDIFNAEKTAVEIADTLRKSGVTIKKLFTITKWDYIESRSNLPAIKDYIKDKVDTFHKMDLPIAFRLLGKAGQLLRVAYAGCNGFRCSKVVINVLSKYQDLVREATTLSSHFVNICIRSLRYHRYSVYFLRVKKELAKSQKQFLRTIPLATKMKGDSEKVVNHTETIRDMCSTAIDQAMDQSMWAKNKKLDWKDKMRRYEEMKNNLDKDSDKLKRQADVLSNAVAEMRKEEAKVETMKELERRKSVLSLRCNLVTRDVFRRVCNTVTSWWGWVRTKSCRYVRGQITENKCRHKINRLLVQLKNDRLRVLSNRLNAYRRMRLKYEQQKLVCQSHQKLLYVELAKTAEQLKRLKDLQRTDNNMLDFAVRSLDLAEKSMIIVKTQLKKMSEFWDNVIQHSKSLITRASDTTTTDTAVDDPFIEKILESGFSWFSLAKVMRIAAIEMEKTSAAVDKAFTTLPTTDEVAGIITVEGPKIIKETLTLSTKYNKLVAETQARIEKIKQKQKSDNELSTEVEKIEDEDEEFDEKYNIMKNNK